MFSISVKRKKKSIMHSKIHVMLFKLNKILKVNIECNRVENPRKKKKKKNRENKTDKNY